MQDRLIKGTTPTPMLAAVLNVVLTLTVVRWIHDDQDNAATAAASHRHVHRAGVTCNRWAFGGKVNVQSLHRGAGIKLQWLHTKATAIGSKG